MNIGPSELQTTPVVARPSESATRAAQDCRDLGARPGRAEPEGSGSRTTAGACAGRAERPRQVPGCGVDPPHDCQRTIRLAAGGWAWAGPMQPAHAQRHDPAPGPRCPLSRSRRLAARMRRGLRPAASADAMSRVDSRWASQHCRRQQVGRPWPPFTARALHPMRSHSPPRPSGAPGRPTRCAQSARPSGPGRQLGLGGDRIAQSRRLSEGAQRRPLRGHTLTSFFVQQ